jgi:GT2 family glycosyltransferase
VAFTDSDTFPDETWLEAGLKAAEHYGTQALEGNVMTWPPSAIGPYTHQIRSGDGGRFMTANMFYRRTLLEEVGGFDERFEAPFLEDSDLAFRVLDAGYRIPYAPEVVVRHRVERQSFTDVHRGAKKLRWLALLAAKHPERYRTDFRPLMRPLSHIDIDVIVALAACVAIPRSKGLARAALIATAANGIRRGFASGQVLTAPKGERLQRAALSLSVPVSRAFWWLEGSVRYRTFVS